MHYDTGITIFNQLNMVSVQKFQVFLLAYYYAILLPLVDASQLSIKEGFGSYGWCDFSLFALLEGIRARCGVPGRMPKEWDRPTLSRRSICIMREDVLKLRQFREAPSRPNPEDNTGFRNIHVQESGIMMACLRLTLKANSSTSYIKRKSVEQLYCVSLCAQ